MVVTMVVVNVVIAGVVQTITVVYNLFSICCFAYVFVFLHWRTAPQGFNNQIECNSLKFYDFFLAEVQLLLPSFIVSYALFRYRNFIELNVCNFVSFIYKKSKYFFVLFCAL